MKATEAEKISEENEISLKVIFKQVEGSAFNGNRHCIIYGYVHYLKIDKIVSDGYKVSQFTDPMGVDFIKIEW